MIAGIKNPILVSESTATVTSYAYENIDKLKKLSQRKHVIFIDIGHSKTTVTVASYEFD